ncbi:MAG: GFA family protein [Candidatus Zeuxoniibacter abyssi]|nr:MAG: GFA family protein [Candidatus Persebacteraceae bacterium AB1(2)]
MAMDDSLSGGTLSPISGGCLCGQVRYVLKAPPTEGCFCHCRMCQRASGAFAVAWASVAAADFCLRRGKLRYVNSSSTARRGFCADCGSPIAFDDRGMDDFGVTVASLNSPDDVPIQAHIWTSSKRRGQMPEPHLPIHAEETPEFAAQIKLRKL